MRIFVLLTLLTICISADAQKAPDFRRFRLAPIVGMNVSQIDGDNRSGFYKVGLHAGVSVFAILEDRERFSLSLEMLYNQKGSRNRPNTFPINKILLNYVDIPVQFNYHDKDRMIFGIGMNYARLINAKLVANGLDQPNATEQFDPREIGYLVTATFMVKEKTGIGLRYSGSLTSFGTSVNPAVSGLINRTITFRGSYLF